MSKIFAYPLLIATAIALSLSSVKSAEVEEVAIADQYGIAYLPLTIMKANKLFEKHLDASGLEDTVVTWSTFASGAPATDALLSGKLHIAAGGTGSVSCSVGQDPRYIRREGDCRLIDDADVAGNKRPKY